MTPETKELIRQASRQLRIKDIILFQARFERPNRDPDKMAASGRQEFMRQVQFFTGQVSEEADAVRFLQVVVSLGTRVVPAKVEDGDLPLFTIEAEFLINYEMKDALNEDQLKAFADNNAVHNVWPFWRQHVFDVVQRARLPHLNIPLYSGYQQ